jgi:hypothetical protein
MIGLEPEESMQHDQATKILAVLGGGEPFDITPELAEYPLFLTLTSGLARAVARRDLLQRCAESVGMEEGEAQARRFQALGEEATRLVESGDEEGDRQLRELASEAARFIEAIATSRKEALRVVGERAAVKPRRERTRGKRERPGAVDDQATAGPLPAESGKADGLKRARPKP